MFKWILLHIKAITSTSTLTTLTTPRRYYTSRILTAYQDCVSAGQLKQDSHQISVIKKLEQLDGRLLRYSPSSGTSSPLSSLLSIFGLQASGFARGLYLYGDVGCGKTMLMDLFYDYCSVNSSSKKRIHFHAFMLEFHSRLHRYKMEHKATTGTSKGPALSFNPIPAIAAEILSESWLLCLDEFQVTDIGDAMILRHVFKELFNGGMVMVATSNRAPDDLYKNGLQRSNFLPFIPMLKKQCKVVKLQSGIDYRRLMGGGGGGGGGEDSGSHLQTFYLTDAASIKQLDTVFKVLAAQETDTVRPKTLTISGRNVNFAKACGQVLDATFTELCDQPLGAVDYLRISASFHTIIVRAVPKMDLKNRTQARRFITMVDTFYDNRNRVIFSADVMPDELFCGEGAGGGQASDDDRKLMDDLNVADTSAAIFSGEEEVFAFYRTLSRMAEMQSAAYWNAAGPEKK